MPPKSKEYGRQPPAKGEGGNLQVVGSGEDAGDVENGLVELAEALGRLRGDADGRGRFDSDA